MAFEYSGMMTMGENISVCEKANESNSISLPVSPSEIMFKVQGDLETQTLLNYGEVPVGMTNKLIEWSISSFFPTQGSKYWFDPYGGEYHPYQYYCKQFYDWQKAHTILVFQKETWDGFYDCMIKNFEFGEQDSTGNVRYTLDFVQYKIAVPNSTTTTTDYTKGKTNYSGKYYYPDNGETVLTIAKKLYGSTEYYRTLLKLNGWTDPTRKMTKGERVIIR
nr:MAG TPA: tail assembly protein [Caudoviricetes sp.]